MTWHTLIGVLGGIALTYLVLLALLWSYARTHPQTTTSRDALRLLPDLLRLLRRLAADPAVPRGVRIRLALLLVYLAAPIDLIPDFVPVLGYADDAILTAIVLRSVIRSSGPSALTRHWPGAPEGLHLIQRLAGTRRT